MRAAVAACVLAAACACPHVLAADAAPAAIETPWRDPWVPPAQRVPSKEAPAEGEALRAQVNAKLAAAFAAADTAHTGTLTRAQAKAAGLGFVANHFDDIDVRRSGTIRFDDVIRYLDERRASQSAPR